MILPFSKIAKKTRPIIEEKDKMSEITTSEPLFFTHILLDGQKGKEEHPDATREPFSIRPD